MKLNKYALVLFLGLGTLTSCNDNLELLNPNQQTSNTFGFNADDLEESVIAAYNHIRMEGSYARVGYTIDVCRGDEAWNSSQVWYLPFDDLNAEVTSDITWWPWREWYYTVNVCNFAISRCDEDNSQLSEKMKRIKGQVSSCAVCHTTIWLVITRTRPSSQIMPPTLHWTDFIPATAPMMPCWTKWKVISKKPWNCYPHEIKVANGKKDVPPVVPQPVTMPVRSWYAINSKTPLLY